MRVISVIGGKNSGKTTTIENLVKELTKRGINVAVIKHISQPFFTIDAPGKDTWKFAQAGAKTIISVAKNEIAKIEKVSIEKLTLSNLLKKCKKNELVIIEGLRKLVGSDDSIPKIIIAKTEKEANDAKKLYKPIIAFSGPIKLEKETIPYADGLINSKQLADIVISWIEKTKS